MPGTLLAAAEGFHPSVVLCGQPLPLLPRGQVPPVHDCRLYSIHLCSACTLLPSGAPSPRALGEAAVAAAEASGALPPLAGAQRSAVEGFFARLAAELPAGAGGECEKEGGPFEDFGGWGRRAGEGWLGASAAWMALP